MLRDTAAGLSLIGATALAVLAGSAALSLPAGAQDAAPGCVETGWFGSAAIADGATYAGSRAALVDHLALVPNTAEGLAGSPMVSYSDLEAKVRAGFAKTNPDAGWGTMTFRDLLPALHRVASGPAAYVQDMFIFETSLADTLGLTIADIHRGLEFGRPPETGMVLGLNPDAEVGETPTAALAAALGARGFERQMEHGIAIWHRYDDNEMRIVDRETGDPFWGNLGRSSRIFLHGTALAGTPAWPLARAMAAAAIDKDPSLADNTDVCATVAAVAAGEGMLLQFVLLDPADTIMIPATLALPDDSPPELVTPPATAGALPPYRMVAMADRFYGDKDQAVVALVYASRGNAETAAATLAARFAAFEPASRPEAWGNLLRDVRAEIAVDVLTVGEGGPYVAVITITYRSIFPTDAPEDGMRQVGGRVFKLLLDAYFRQELTPLVVQ